MTWRSKVFNKLRKQLAEMGITKAAANEGTSEGYPVIFLRWNGRDDVYTGIIGNEMDPMAQEITEQRFIQFKDENLD